MLYLFNFRYVSCIYCKSQWPRGLKRRSAAARLLRLWVRIPPGAWMSVCCECCVLSGRGLCDGLITRPEESYRLWCVVVCDLETSRMKGPWPALGRSATGQIYIYIYIYIFTAGRNWGSVVIFQSQKGSASRKCGQHCSTEISLH